MRFGGAWLAIRSIRVARPTITKSDVPALLSDCQVWQRMAWSVPSQMGSVPRLPRKPHLTASPAFPQFPTSALWPKYHSFVSFFAPPPLLLLLLCTYPIYYNQDDILQSDPPVLQSAARCHFHCPNTLLHFPSFEDKAAPPLQLCCSTNCETQHSYRLCHDFYPRTYLSIRVTESRARC